MTTDLSENPHHINYVFDPPSLKSMAMVTIAVKIYGYPDDSEDSESYDDDDSMDETVGSRELALQRLEKIALPQLLKHQVSNIIKPIEQQWRGWIDYTDGEVYKKYCDLKKLFEERCLSYWTMEGIVDLVKLLKDIFDEVKNIKNKRVDYVALYETACMYCMEEYISEFWSKLRKKKKFKGYARTRYYHLHIIAYWTASMSNELPRLMDEILENDRSDIYDMDFSIHENLISAFILSGNLIAFKYFWNHKLTEEEKGSNIKNWTVLVLETIQKEHFESFTEHFDLCNKNNPNKKTKCGCGIGMPLFDFFPLDDCNFIYQDYNSHTYILCFLLTHLNSHSEQKEIFKSYPKVILLSLFFHWPLQRYFLPTITIMFEFLNENLYVGIMKTIGDSIIQRRTEVIFREVWDVSPPHLKKSFLNYLQQNARAIIQMLLIGDDMTIDRILRNATEDEKHNIIFRVPQESEFYRFLRSFIDSDKRAISAIDRLASKNLPEEAFRLFKFCIMLNYGKDLSSEWILSRELTSLNMFWNWTCQSPEECSNFKKKYIDLEDLYISLLISEECDYVDEFLNWYFETEDKIKKFKESFVCNDNLTYCKSLIIHFSKNGAAGWELFQKFLNFSFHSSDGIELAKNIFKGFVEQDQSFSGMNDEFNTLFKNWCFNFK